MASTTVITKTYGSTKSIMHEADYHTMSKVFFCVTPFHRATLYMHTIASHFYRTTYVVQLAKQHHLT
jgi:hypothetical protein